ncbi:MAG: flagellar biosynthesis anti-sigma factor FlgM [Gammaproteobacteria bacterium]|nr:flagellar biosynthesis anti-sigma factor FlgM [Gammaproteobacteria bacterium]
MANDISGVTPRPPVSQTTPIRAQANLSEAPSAPRDSVALSLTGLLDRADAVLHATSEINEAKVRELSNAIAEGRYQPNLSNVADKMIAFEGARHSGATEPTDHS